MAASGVNIGMMDAAYFVGRKEILEWLNGLLRLNLSKIEETASGAIACQLVDIIYPGAVPMKRVKWNAKLEYEFVHNYKILQTVFNKLKIDKHIEVDRLIRAKYQDNLEFMQWMKRFYDLNINEANLEGYDPVARRRAGVGTFAAPAAVSDAAAAAAPQPPAASSTAAPASERAPAKAASAASSGKENRIAPAKRAGATGARAQPASTAAAPPVAPTAESDPARDKLRHRVVELKQLVEGLEKERDFYFGKLRDIEVLLQGQTWGDQALVDNVFKILYATEEDFVAADEAGDAREGGPSGDDEPAAADEGLEPSDQAEEA